MFVSVLQAFGISKSQSDTMAVDERKTQQMESVPSHCSQESSDSHNLTRYSFNCRVGCKKKKEKRQSDAKW